MAGTRTHMHAQMSSVILMDLLSLVAGSAGGILLRFGPAEVARYVFGHLEGWLLLFGSVLLANYLAGNYRLQHTFSRFNLAVTWLFSILFAVLILSITSYAWFAHVLGRGVLILSLAFYSALALLLKMALYRALFRQLRFECRTLMLGTGRLARELRRMIENESILPVHKVVAWVNPVSPAGPGPGPADAPVPAGRLLEGRPVLEAEPGELEAVARGLGADVVVLGFENDEEAGAYYAPLKRLRFAGIEVLPPLSAAEIYSGRLPLALLSEEYMMRASMESGLPAVRRLKRLFDAVAAAVALVLVAPAAALIAALIKLSAPGSSVLHTQTRAGQFGRPFRMVKFRTMRPDAEAQTGPVWAAADDPRVVRLGRVLRRFRLDEIPQLLNVIRSDMSLVGPRPERPEIAARLEEKVPFFGERQNAKPGLTGWAQVRHPYGDSAEDAARKLEYDLYYIKNQSLALDLQIILSTLRIVLFGKERSL
ncbi:MAG: exopolysaccharide biosynthesis polyprenyl glycosylphosphotransferase [Verrucomicrobiota bacterium]|nr:exopolysaccharide biosynthesis polyprenyl glycosylphosphotransferase [Verrucomicrobiota bacterium]